MACISKCTRLDMRHVGFARQKGLHCGDKLPLMAQNHQFW